MKRTNTPSPEEMNVLVDDVMPHTREVKPRPKPYRAGSTPSHGSETDCGGNGGRISASQNQDERDEPGDFDWSESVPLDTVPELPEFDPKLLPGVYGEMVQAVAEARSVPTALPGMLMLAVLGSCYARGWSIWGNEDWEQPTNLYVIVALPSGSRKSSVFADLLGPVSRFETQIQEQSKGDIARATSDREIRSKTLSALQKQASGKGDAADQARLEAEDLAAQLETEDLPTMPRLIAEDVTPEALCTLLSQQRGRIMLASSECDLFGIMQGRYSDKRAGGTNLGPFLKGHDGEKLTIDRTGRPLEIVESPLLSMAVCAQPSALSGLFADRSLTGRGLLNRCLIAVPQSGLGHRPVTTPRIPVDLRDAYESAIVRALGKRQSLENSPPSPPQSPESFLGAVRLTLEPKARGALEEYQLHTERLMREGEVFSGEIDSGFASKLAGSVLRVSAILELSKNLDALQVSPASMIEAIALSEECFEPHAIAARGMAMADDDTKRAVAMLRWLCRKRPEAFTRREAYHALKGGGGDRLVKRTQDLAEAIERLKDHGYIIPIDADERVSGRAGRPTNRYAVHPGILSGEVQPPENR